jgi:hypothetical protein
MDRVLVEYSVHVMELIEYTPTQCHKKIVSVLDPIMHFKSR